jgi:DNA repair exonuclease SbcCD ATPase subunit
LKDFKKLGRQYANELEKLKTYVAGAMTCPNCSFEFVLDAAKEVKTMKIEIKKLSKSVKDIAERVYDIQDKLDDHDKKVAKIRELQRSINPVLDKIEELRFEIETDEKKIDNNLKNIQKCNIDLKELEGLEPEDNSKQIVSIRKSIADGRGFLKKLNAEYESLDNSLKYIKSWEINFKRFKMYISNGILKNIETRANDILEILDADYTVEINGFKYKADGSIKEEIGITISRQDKEPESFYSFSGGERARAEFAVIMAIRDIINSKNKSGGLKFLLIDELFSEVDAVGLGNIMKAIEFISEDILVISHVSDERVMADKLTIKKVDEISKIS